MGTPMRSNMRASAFNPLRIPVATDVTVQAGVQAGKRGRFGVVSKRSPKITAPTEEDDEFISPELQENIQQAAYLFMRLAVASVMIHHGEEKILSADAFTKFAIDKYFSFLPGPHIFWTYSAGAAQSVGSLLLSLG